MRWFALALALLLGGVDALSTRSTCSPPCRGTASRSRSPIFYLPSEQRWRARLQLPLVKMVLPQVNDLDKRIATLYFPSLANLLVVPITGAVDTFWVGRMGDALALAGQGAANQLFATISFLASFVPTVTVPLVASAYARGDLKSARERTSDSLFLAGVIGVLTTICLVGYPQRALRVLLPADSLAAPYASRYLQLRSLSLIAAIASSVAFAAFRACLDVVTPLKVSLSSNLINLVLDPILIFSAHLGVAGAAIATVISEVRPHATPQHTACCP